MSNSDIHDTTYNKYNKINMILKKYYNVNNTNPELEWWEEPYQKQDQKVLSENILSEPLLTQRISDSLDDSNNPPLNIIYNVIDICYNIEDFSFNGISIQITENQKILENSINDKTERRIDIDLSKYDVSNIVITDAVSNDVSYNPTLKIINRADPGTYPDMDLSMNKDFFIESQTNRLSVSIDKLDKIEGILQFKYYSYKRDNTDLSDGYFDTGINTLSKLNNIYVQDISFSSERIQLFKPQIDLSFSIVCNNLYIYDNRKNYQLVPTDGSLQYITLNAGERGEKGDNPAADLDGSPGDDYKFSKYKTNFFINDKYFADIETPDGINLSKKLKNELDNNFTFITGPQGDPGFIGGRGLKNPQEFSHVFTNIIDDYFESEDGTGFCNIGNIELKSGVKFDVEVLKRNGFYRRTESAMNIEKDLEKCDVYTMFPFAVKKNNADPTTCAWSGIVCNLHNHTIEAKKYDNMNLLKNATNTFIAGGDYSDHDKKDYWTDDHIFFSNIFQGLVPSDFSQRNHFRKLWKHTNIFKNLHDSHWKYDTDYEIEITTGTLGADNFFSCWIFYPHDRVESQNGEDAGTYLTKKMSLSRRHQSDKIKKRFIPLTELIETAKVEEIKYFEGETFWLDLLYFSRVKLRIPSMVTYHSLSSTRIQNSWIMYDKLNYSSNPDASFNDANMNTRYTKPLRFKKWQLMHFNIFLHNCVYNSIQNTEFPNYYEMFNEYKGLLLPIIAGKTNSTKLANNLYNIHYDKRTKSFMKLPVYTINRYKISVLPSTLHKQTLNALDVFWRLWIMQGTWHDPSNNMMGYREPIRIKDYRSQHTFKNGNKITDRMEYDFDYEDKDIKRNNNIGQNRKYLNTISRGFKPYNNNSDFLISNMGTGLGVPVNTDAMGCGFNADSTIPNSEIDKNSPYKLERWMYGKNRYQADFLWSINSEWLPSFNEVLHNGKSSRMKERTGLYMGDGTLVRKVDEGEGKHTFFLFDKYTQNEYLSHTFRYEARDRKYGSLRHYNLNYRYRWPFYHKILTETRDVHKYLKKIGEDGYGGEFIHSNIKNNDLLLIKNIDNNWNYENMFFNPRWENTNQVPQTIFTDRYDFENYMYEYDGDWGPSYNDLSNVLHGTFQDIIMNEPSVIYNKKYLKKWNGQKLLIDTEEMNIDYIKLEGSGSDENWNPTITKNSWYKKEDRRNFLNHPRNKLNLKHSTHKSHWNQGYYDDMHLFQPTRKWWLVDMYKEHINQFKISNININELIDESNNLVTIWRDSSNIEQYENIFKPKSTSTNVQWDGVNPYFYQMTIELDANFNKDQIPFFKLSINHDIFKYLRNPITKKYYTINDNFIPLCTDNLFGVSNEIIKVSVWKPSSDIFDSKIIIRFHLLNTYCNNGLEFFQDGSFSHITIRNSNEHENFIILLFSELSISEQFKDQSNKTNFKHNWVDIMYEIDTSYYDDDEIHPINKLTNNILNKTSYVDIHLEDTTNDTYYYNGIPIVSSINDFNLIMNDICIIDTSYNNTLNQITLTFSDNVEIDCINTIYSNNIEYLLETYINPTINIKAYGADISNILYNIPFHISRKKLLYEGSGKNNNKTDISYNEDDASLNMRTTYIEQIEHKYKCIKINDLDVEEMNKDFKLYCYYNGLDCSNLFYDFTLNGNDDILGEKGLHNLLRDKDFFKDSVIKSEPENIWNMLLEEYNNCLNLEFYIQKMDNTEEKEEITFQRMPYTEINDNINYYEKENFIKSLDILGLHFTNINENNLSDNIEFYTLPLTFIRNDNHIDKYSFNENIYITSDVSELTAAYDISYSKGLWVLEFNSLYSEGKGDKTLQKSDLKNMWSVENQITLNNNYSTIIDNIENKINDISNIKWNNKNRIVDPGKYKNEEYLRWKIKLTRNVIPFSCLVKQLEYHLIYKFGENVRTPDEITVIKKSIHALGTFLSLEKSHRVTKDEFIDWFTTSNIEMVMNHKDINSNFNRDTLLNSMLDKNAVNDFKYMYKKFITEGDGMAKFYDFDFRNEMKLLKGLDFDYNINLTWPNDPITDILNIAAGMNANKGTEENKWPIFDKLAVYNVLEKGGRNPDGTLDPAAYGSKAHYLLGRVIVPYDLMTESEKDNADLFETPHFMDSNYYYIYPERQYIDDNEFYEVMFNNDYMIKNVDKIFISENNSIQKYKSNDVLTMIIDTFEAMNMQTILNIYNKRQKWYDSNTIHIMGSGSVCLIFDNLLKIYGENGLSNIIKNNIELLEINDFDDEIFDDFLNIVLENADGIINNTTTLNDIFTVDENDDSADYVYSYNGFRLEKALLYESFLNLIMISDTIQLAREVNSLVRKKTVTTTPMRNEFNTIHPDNITANKLVSVDNINTFIINGEIQKDRLMKRLSDDTDLIKSLRELVFDELVFDNDSDIFEYKADSDDVDDELIKKKKRNEEQLNKLIKRQMELNKPVIFYGINLNDNNAANRLFEKMNKYNSNLIDEMDHHIFISNIGSEFSDLENYKKDFLENGIAAKKDTDLSKVKETRLKNFIAFDKERRNLILTYLKTGPGEALWNELITNSNLGDYDEELRREVYDVYTSTDGNWYKSGYSNIKREELIAVLEIKQDIPEYNGVGIIELKADQSKVMKAKKDFLENGIAAKKDTLLSKATETRLKNFIAFDKKRRDLILKYFKTGPGEALWNELIRTSNLAQDAADELRREVYDVYTSADGNWYKSGYSSIKREELIAVLEIKEEIPEYNGVGINELKADRVAQRNANQIDIDKNRKAISDLQDSIKNADKSVGRKIVGKSPKKIFQNIIGNGDANEVLKFLDKLQKKTDNRNSRSSKVLLNKLEGLRKAKLDILHLFRDKKIENELLDIIENGASEKQITRILTKKPDDELYESFRQLARVSEGLTEMELLDGIHTMRNAIRNTDYGNYKYTDKLINEMDKALKNITAPSTGLDNYDFIKGVNNAKKGFLQNGINGRFSEDLLAFVNNYDESSRKALKEYFTIPEGQRLTKGNEILKDPNINDRYKDKLRELFNRTPPITKQIPNTTIVSLLEIKEEIPEFDGEGINDLSIKRNILISKGGTIEQLLQDKCDDLKRKLESAKDPKDIKKLKNLLNNFLEQLKKVKVRNRRIEGEIKKKKKRTLKRRNAYTKKVKKPVTKSTNMKRRAELAIAAIFTYFDLNDIKNKLKKNKRVQRILDKLKGFRKGTKKFFQNIGGKLFGGGAAIGAGGGAAIGAAPAGGAASGAAGGAAAGGGTAGAVAAVVIIIIIIIVLPIVLSMFSLTGFDRKPFHNIMNRWEATLGRTYHAGNPWREQMRPGVRVLKGHHVYESNGSTDIALALAGITDGNPYDSTPDQTAMSIYRFGDLYAGNDSVLKEKEVYPTVDNLFIIIYPNSDIFMSGKRSTSYIWDLYCCFWGVRTSQFQWLTSRRKGWNWNIYRNNKINGFAQYITDIAGKLDSPYFDHVKCIDDDDSEVPTRGRILNDKNDWWSVQCVDQELIGNNNEPNNKFDKYNILLKTLDPSDNTLCVITAHEFEPLHPDYDVEIIYDKNNKYIKGPKNKKWLDTNGYNGYYTIDNIQSVTVVLSTDISNQYKFDKVKNYQWDLQSGEFKDIQITSGSSDDRRIKLQLCLSPTNEIIYYPTQIEKEKDQFVNIWEDSINSNCFSDSFYNIYNNIANPGSVLRTEIHSGNIVEASGLEWNISNLSTSSEVRYIYKAIKPNNAHPYGKTVLSKRPYYIIGKRGFVSSNSPLNPVHNDKFKIIDFGLEVVANDQHHSKSIKYDTDKKTVISIISKIDDPDMVGVYDFIDTLCKFKQDDEDKIRYLPLYVKSNTQMSKITLYTNNGTKINDTFEDISFVPHRRWDTIYTDLLNADWNVYTYLNWQWDYNKIDDELKFDETGFAGNAIYNNNKNDSPVTFKSDIIHNNGTKLIKVVNQIPRNQDIPAYLHCWWLYDMFDGGPKNNPSNVLRLHPANFEHNDKGIVKTKTSNMYQVGTGSHFMGDKVKHFTQNIGWHIHRKAYWNNLKFSAVIDTELVAKSIFYECDRRIKRNITPLSNEYCIDIINKLQTKTYKIRGQYKDDTTNYGFIAQEVEKILPMAVKKVRSIIPNVSRYTHDFNWYDIHNVPKTHLDDSMPKNTKYILKINDLKKSEVSNETNACYEFVIQYVNKSNKTINKRVTLIKSNKYNNEFYIDEKMDNINHIFIKGYSINDMRTVNHSAIFNHHTGAVKYLIKKGEDLKKRREETMASIDAKREKIQKMKSLLIEKERRLIKLKQRLKNINI